MSANAKRIKEIKDAAAQKKVFIVEGSDDIPLWERWFSLYQSHWETKWHIAYAGNKKQVIDILRVEPTWFGSVDQDEWLPEKIRELQQELPNLHILPRFCAENYLIVPDEIWLALPANQQNKIAGGIDEFSRELLRELDQYLKHGALWYTINPLWEGLRSKGFKEDLLDIQHADDLEYIRDKLREWYDFLNPQQIEDRYNKRLIDAQNSNLKMQLCQNVHGKIFFKNVIHPQFNQWFSQQDEAKLRQALIKQLQLPDDIRPILQRIGL